MAPAEQELVRFTEFVKRRLDADNSERSLTELFDLWVLENPSDADYAEDAAAINASIQDFLHGERGTPAGEHSEELRKEFGVPEE